MSFGRSLTGNLGTSSSGVATSSRVSLASIIVRCLSESTLLRLTSGIGFIDPMRFVVERRGKRKKVKRKNSSKLSQEKPHHLSATSPLPPPYLLLFPSFSCSRAFLLASAIPSETASASDPSAIPLALATSTAALAASRCSASSAAFLDAAAALFALAIAGNRASSLSAATAPPKTPAAPTAKTAQTLLSLAWAAAAACFGRGLAAESASEADRVSISARATGRTGAARGATARQRERAAAVAAAAAAEEKWGAGEVVVFPPFPSSPAHAAARPRARARARVPPCRGRSLKVSRSLPEVDAAAVAVGAREAWLFGSLFCAQGGGKTERIERPSPASNSFGERVESKKKGRGRGRREPFHSVSFSDP